MAKTLRTPILAKCGLAKCGHENELAKFGSFFWPNAVLAKCGLAKCGHDHGIALKDDRPTGPGDQAPRTRRQRREAWLEEVGDRF